ncbi:MAG TPA: hypothetical protein V6C89_14430 [Drouetiella sp.]|jgi:hypothetical protein
MIIPIRQTLSIACLALAFGLPLSPGSAELAKTDAKPAAKSAAKPVAKSAPSSSATAPVASATAADPASNPAVARQIALSAAVKQYKAKPDSYSWDSVWKVVRDILSQPATVKAPASAILASYPGLSELGVSVIDGEGSRVWAFPKVSDNQNVMLQWSGAVATTVQRPVGRRHKIVSQVAVTTVPHSQVLQIPAGVVLNDAHLATGAHALTLTGNMRGSGAVWLQGYKNIEGQWTETGDVFSSIPPFLTQNLVGKASFSGNDLVLTVGGAKTAAGKAQPTSSGYKIVLHYVDGHYSLDARTNEEGPALVALQFIQAVQQGHSDLAKGWLADPRLISIPKYIGLNRSAGLPFKIIAMANPGTGAFRYRCMTFEKNDLIMDIGKVKNQWAVKALFIAPPDPLAQKLVGSLPAPEKSADAKASEESNK